MAANFAFKVRQVAGTNFSYEAEQVGGSDVVPLQQSYTAGTFPEVEQHLVTNHGLTISPPLRYYSSFGDTYDSDTGTWTFKRGGQVIEVVDCPRTIAIISGITERGGVI